MRRVTWTDHDDRCGCIVRETDSASSDPHGYVDIVMRVQSSQPGGADSPSGPIQLGLELNNSHKDLDFSGVCLTVDNTGQSVLVQ